MQTSTYRGNAIYKGKDMKVSELGYIPINVQKSLEFADVIELNDLIRLHTSPRRCLEVSAQTDLPLDTLQEVISSAIFYQVPGIGSYHSSLLVKSGVDSVDKLANIETEDLLSAMKNLKTGLGMSVVLPSNIVVEHWKRSAQRVCEELDRDH